MEHCAGRSVHLTPSGLDFDEQRVQLMRPAPSVAGLSWDGPRCSALCHDADNLESHSYENTL